MPVQAIIGHSTNSRWKAALCWESRTWQFTQPGQHQKLNIPWHSSSTHWRAPFKLLSASKVVIPPHSHGKVAIINPFKLPSSPNAIQGTFGFVSPRVALTTCLVAQGVADSPTWVQVANPSDEPLLIEPGLHLCNFHSREEWDTKVANIDPTREDIRAEKLAKLSANLSKLEQRKQQEARSKSASARWYESVTVSPGSSPCNESQIGSHDTVYPGGDNGEDRHELIIPLSKDPITTFQRGCGDIVFRGA